MGRMVRQRLSGAETAAAATEAACAAELSAVAAPATSLLVDLLDDDQPLMVSAGCVAVGEMGRCGPLLVVDAAAAPKSAGECQKGCDQVLRPSSPFRDTLWT